MLNKCCISINARCNLACKYCHFYENDGLNMPNIKSLDNEKLLAILHNILDFTQAKNLPLFTIGFAGGGEPLLDWEILKNTLHLIRKKDINKQLSFYIITNGILLNKKFLTEYKDFFSFVKLVISLDGDKDTHDTFRIDKDKKGTHTHIMKNINLYNTCFHEMPAINLSISKKSLTQKENILNFLLSNNFKEITFTRLFHCDDKALEITHTEFLEFISFFEPHPFNIRNTIARKEGKCDCIMYGHKCGVGYNNIFYFNDKVYPCMRYVEDDFNSIGNYSDSLFDIVNNMQRLQKPISEGECHYEKY